jgi:hypothetical protein
MSALAGKQVAVASWLDAALNFYAQVGTSVLNAAFARALRSCSLPG